MAAEDTTQVGEEHRHERESGVPCRHRATYCRIGMEKIEVDVEEDDEYDDDADELLCHDSPPIKCV